MPNTTLLIQLRELHENLSVINDDLKIAEQVDEETVEELGQLVTDLSDLVDRAKAGADHDGAEAGREELLNSIEQFQTEHPRVKHFLSQVSSILTSMEI